MEKTGALIATVVMCQVVFSQVANSAKAAANATKKKSPLATITGSADVYYRYNFNNPKIYPYNSLTSFTHSSNSFELGMASIRADHSVKLKRIEENHL